MRPRARRSGATRGRRGFTLFEALIAVALMGLVLALLGIVTAQWLPAWNFGLARLQRADLVGLAIERITADLVSAEFLSLDPKSQRATFDGTPSSVLFVRSALGPNAQEGLEIIRFAEEQDGTEFALVRSRAPFALLVGEVADAPSLAFADKVTLLRSPFRVSFAFADDTLEWRELWRNVPTLPSAVRISVEDPGKRGGLFLSAVATLHMNAAAICARASSTSGCVEELAQKGSVQVDPDAQERNP